MAAARTYIEIESRNMSDDLPLKKQLKLIANALANDKALEEAIVSYRVMFQKFCTKDNYKIKYNYQWMMVEIAMYNLLTQKNGRCFRQ